MFKALLPSADFSFDSRIDPVIGHLPFFLLCGLEPASTSNCVISLQAPAADQGILVPREVREDVTLALFPVAEWMKYHCN